MARRSGRNEQRTGDGEADTAARVALEAKVADQKERLNALGRGLEETMRALSETRAELERVRRERNELERRLAAVENMQTATLALTEADKEEPEAVIHALPSVEELMAGLRSFQAAEPPPAPPEQDEEMLPPELVFSDDSDEPDEEEPAPVVRGRNSKMLVFVDADPPIKYPLFEAITTIGRSENADIRVDGDYISRIHARIVLGDGRAVVEDTASKNGIKVNFKRVQRHTLKHGDILSLGKLHFTFIDTAAADDEEAA